jgi:malonyl-CoA/methylmalonyl-CoA synthetase
MTTNTGNLLGTLLPPYLPRDAVRIGATTLDYAELAERARAHAGALLAAGIQPGDRVLVWATSSLDTIVAMIGQMLAGIVSVPVNPAADDGLLAHYLRDAAPRAVIGDVAPARVAPVPVMAVGHASYNGPLPTPAADAPILILYTSGTTGAPKGAVHTPANLAANLSAVARAWQWTERDVLVHALPLFHGHGVVLGLLGPLYLGGTVRILPRFEIDALTTALREECTMLFGAPAMFHQLIERAERDATVAAALRSPRILVTGSTPFPAREQERIQRLIGRRVIERYGITEALISASTRPQHDLLRPGHVGVPLDGVEIRLVDDDRKPLDPGDHSAMGEIAIRSPGLFREYLNRPAATAAARDADGWFYTGDMGRIDASGVLRILGRRSSDFIELDGRRLAALEIESALLEHPAIREAAVTGVHDAARGRIIGAGVVVREGAGVNERDILAWAAKVLPEHARPGAVKLIDELPRNAIGKVVRSMLRDTLQAALPAMS